MFAPWTSASTGGQSGDMGTLRAGSPDRAVTGLATCVVVAADSAGAAGLTVPALTTHGGRLLSTAPPEQVVAVFSAASDSAHAALAVRAAAPAGIRMDLHSGYVRGSAGGPAHGPAIRRCERLARAAGRSARAPRAWPPDVSAHWPSSELITATGCTAESTEP